ncbi:unnamed protein product, partial [Rotaria magnacalcarata]
KPLLLIDEYVFKLNKNTTTTKYWIYTLNECSAKVHTDLNSQFIKIVGDHNHFPEKEQLEVREFREKVKQRAIHETTPIPRIYDEECAKAMLSNATIAALPSEREMSSGINNARRAITPTIPTAQLFEIPDLYSKTLSKNSFLVVDKMITRRQRILLFSSREQLKMLFGAETILVDGTCSRWFPIKRGGPQGSSLTPSVFITYHSDMSDAFPMAMSFLFADDVAATMAGQMGIKYTDQCIDLEKRLASFFDNLEYYSVLPVQPINYKKTHAMWSARAVSYPNPMPILKCGEHIISWTNQFKYLGYWISTKLGWSSLINYTLLKIRQRMTLVNICKYAGVSSNEVRRILFSTCIPFICLLICNNSFVYF